MKVKVGPFTYDVKYKKEVRDIDGNLVWGSISHMRQTIDIATGDTSTEERQQVALLHELLHALSNTYVIGLQEEQVEVLANTLIDLFGRNKNVRDRIVG